MSLSNWLCIVNLSCSETSHQKCNVLDMNVIVACRNSAVSLHTAIGAISCMPFLSSLLLPFPGEFHWVVGCEFWMSSALTALSSTKND